MIQTLSDALAKQGYDTLTPVQEAVTDPALAQADLLVSAQTGSGKTVGFGLAIAETLLGDATRFDAATTPLALVIAPTRELAMQVNRELTWLYGLAGAVVTSCVGGMDMRTERRALERGAHIVVATPGRLVDHINRGSIDMSGIRAVVLDEADEMLDLGFREDLEFILESAPETRRTLMFSATVPKMIATLAQTYQRDAVRVQTVSENKQHSDITYRAMPVAAHDAENAIINVLRYYDAENAIVFCNTRAMVNRMTTRLTNRGFSVVALSGELSQTERSHALQAMRDGRAKVCVATDVAARGIDLPKLELVVHGELPTSSDTLLHRSGRTGRAGRKGVSALIVPARFRKKTERLLGWAKLTAEWGPAPSAADVQEKDQERMLADPKWHDPVTEDEAPMVEKLTGEFDASALAAAYLRLYYEKHTAPEELSDPDTRPERAERKPFGPSVWFSLSTGRKNGAEPRRLLPMICKAGELTKEDIGAIRIQFNESYVEVKQSSVAGFVAALDGATHLEEGVAITQLSAPPALEERGPRPPRDSDTSGPKGNWKDKNNDGGGHRKGPRKSFDDAPRPKSKWQPDDSAIADTPAPAAKPQRPAKPSPSEARPPRSDKSDAAKPYKGKPKPAGESKWAKPDGERPRKPASKPYAKSEGKPAGKFGGKPDGKSGGGKPFGKPTGKPSGKPAGKSGGKPFAKAGGKPKGKPAAAPARASDTSKRFTPPSKAKGGSTPPRRG